MSTPHQAVSAETEARTTPSEQGKHPIVDPASGHACETLMPSEVVPPTRTDSEPQQASTQPGDGGKMHAPPDRVEEQPGVSPREGNVPWKDQVIGYAKLTRGKVLGKDETKDVGHKILQGEIAPQETHKVSN